MFLHLSALSAEGDECVGGSSNGGIEKSEFVTFFHAGMAVG